MGDDISSGLLSMSVCFDFWSTNVVQLSIGTCTSTGFDVITRPAYLSLDRQSCIKSSGLALYLGQKTFDLKFLDFDL